ncbi:MAG TPA: formylmethanofuran dehydrogenase subunit C [Planctomycetaceae bacterium]|nr:formylmethanofuran dehydrogenase subunit C [Planctomycetaceae bacterium]
MVLRLRYVGTTSIPVEVEGLTPDRVADQTLAEIERYEIFHGNRKIPLAEMFSVSGDPRDQQFEIEGNLAGVHWLGAHMRSGSIRTAGPVGRHLGSQMRGGSIHVSGDAADWVGAEMRGGSIHVHGNSGHLVGGGYRGSPKGMTGGMLLIDGDAGNEIGHTMRRGLVAIGGNAGQMLGFNMIAGTVLVFGECGLRPGAGMRRGTLGLFGNNPPPLLPTFRRGSTFQPTFLRVLLRDLKQRGFAVPDDLMTSNYTTHHGDLISVGRGEILLRDAN